VIQLSGFFGLLSALAFLVCAYFWFRSARRAPLLRAFGRASQTPKAGDEFNESLAASAADNRTAAYWTAIGAVLQAASIFAQLLGH
jgi:hypothetical protein